MKIALSASEEVLEESDIEEEEIQAKKKQRPTKELLANGIHITDTKPRPYQTKSLQTPNPEYTGKKGEKQYLQQTTVIEWAYFIMPVIPIEVLDALSFRLGESQDIGSHWVIVHHWVDKARQDMHHYAIIPESYRWYGYRQVLICQKSERDAAIIEINNMLRSIFMKQGMATAIEFIPLFWYILSSLNHLAFALSK